MPWVARPRVPAYIHGQAGSGAHACMQLTNEARLDKCVGTSERQQRELRHHTPPLPCTAPAAELTLTP